MSHPPQTFHLFPFLPVELRAIVWESTGEDGRILRITRLPQSESKSESEEPTKWTSPTPIPAVLQACRESRKYAPYTKALSDHCPEGRYVWMSFELDVIILPEASMITKDLVLGALKKMQYIVWLDRKTTTTTAAAATTPTTPTTTNSSSTTSVARPEEDEDESAATYERARRGRLYRHDGRPTFEIVINRVSWQQLNTYYSRHMQHPGSKRRADCSTLLPGSMWCWPRGRLVIISKETGELLNDTVVHERPAEVERK